MAHRLGFMAKIFPVKSIVRLYSLHRKINRSATVTSVKLFTMFICFNCGATLIFTLCTSETASKKSEREASLILIFIFSDSPGVSARIASMLFLMDSICSCENAKEDIKRKKHTNNFFIIFS
jgi:hypothetical protein